MEIIDQVRQASSIVEIASQYTTLKKRGHRWVGLCPFHTEKTPSFTLDEDKQLYHCFGCGAGGDIFSLVMEKESLNFPEALRYLAEKYHVPMPERARINPEVLKLEDKLFKINDLALGFFRKNLSHTQEGTKALEYLKKRGLADETVQKLRLGYALNSWNALTSFFEGKGVAGALLEKGGLAVPGKKPNEHYDRFRGRVIFPIFSLTGKLVAFGGRTIVDAEPKYLNSPDTPLYSKGKLLYGLNFTKEAIRAQGDAHPGRGIHGLLVPLPGRHRQRRRLPGHGADAVPGGPGPEVRAAGRRQLRRRQRRPGRGRAGRARSAWRRASTSRS